MVMLDSDSMRSLPEYNRDEEKSLEKGETSISGVVHIVDLQGPTLVGSVNFAAANTGSFETYEGSEAYMLHADLQHAAMRAFRAELLKVFPEIEMPEPPAKQDH
jgi:hypothetical protein